MLMGVTQAQTRVAILAASAQLGDQLRQLLEGVGVTVVHASDIGANLLQSLENNPADVLLVDLSGEVEAENDLIDILLENSNLPMVFNDSSPAGGEANGQWAKKLARKLTAMAKTAPQPEAPLRDKPVQAVERETTPQVVSPKPATRPDGAAENVWVLGASLGGPQAVRQFLASIEPDLPVAFVLAQHIGANHMALLAEQLDRVTPFRVVTGKLGHVLRHGEVVLAPAEEQTLVTEDGYLAFAPADPNEIYAPCINQVMAAVAERYGNQAGTIVFSGMGDDGAEGCRAIAKRGGIVWAQDTQSCVVSSMPDQARKTHTVTYSASPQDLARRLYEYYCEN